MFACISDRSRFSGLFKERCGLDAHFRVSERRSREYWMFAEAQLLSHIFSLLHLDRQRTSALLACWDYFTRSRKPYTPLCDSYKGLDVVQCCAWPQSSPGCRCCGCTASLR